MEYLLSLLLLILNLFNYEKKLNPLLMFAVGFLLVASLFYFVFKKTGSFLATCFILMAYTWQISWINIFGRPTSELQLPWFYVLGFLVIIYGFINIKNCFRRNYDIAPILLFSVLFIMILYPLAISKSFSAGVKEIGVIGFFVAVLFTSFLHRDTIGKEAYEHFKTAMIWAVMLTAVFIIAQYVLYKTAGIAVFKIAVRKSFAGYQTSFYLLMEDHSSSSIMLGCAVFYILDRLHRRNWWYYIPALVVIFISMAVTSRRSSTITLIIVIGAFVLFHYRGVAKKILFSVILGLISLIMMYYLLIVRPVSFVGQILNDNGRFNGYLAALDIIAKHPFGIGYDDDYLTTFMPHGISPHNTILRWAAMGGVIFAAVLVGIIVYCLRKARKKRLTAEYWAIFYSFFAANLIPDILAARFFVILCSMALLVKSENGYEAPEIPPMPQMPRRQERVIPEATEKVSE